MKDVITLYKSLSPVQLAALIRSGWCAFSPESPDQQVFSAKLYLAYAEMLARQLEAASYSAGYVVMFELPKQFLEQFEIQSIGYLEHQEYNIPIIELPRMNQLMVGKVQLISAFTHTENIFWQQDKIQLCTAV